jgi:hypothetical protein
MTNALAMLLSAFGFAVGTLMIVGAMGLHP